MQDLTNRITAQRAERQARLDAAAKADNEAQAAVLKRQQEVEDKKTEFTMDLLKAEYKAALDAKDPARIAQAQSALASAQKSLSDIKTSEERAAELDAQVALAEQRRASAVNSLREGSTDTLEREKFLYTKSKDTVAKLGQIMNPENPWPARLGLAQKENNNPEAGVIYVVEEEPGLDKNFFTADKEIPGEMVSIEIPPAVRQKYPTLTGNQIIKRVQELQALKNNKGELINAGLTIEDYLERLERTALKK